MLVFTVSAGIGRRADFNRTISWTVDRTRRIIRITFCHIIRMDDSRFCGGASCIFCCFNHWCFTFAPNQKAGIHNLASLTAMAAWKARHVSFRHSENLPSCLLNLLDLGHKSHMMDAPQINKTKLSLDSEHRIPSFRNPSLLHNQATVVASGSASNVGSLAAPPITLASLSLLAQT